MTAIIAARRTGTVKQQLWQSVGCDQKHGKPNQHLVWFRYPKNALLYNKWLAGETVVSHVIVRHVKIYACMHALSTHITILQKKYINKCLSPAQQHSCTCTPGYERAMHGRNDQLLIFNNYIKILNRMHTASEELPGGWAQSINAGNENNNTVTSSCHHKFFFSCTTIRYL
jgi:hypothetical protein